MSQPMAKKNGSDIKRDISDVSESDVDVNVQVPTNVASIITQVDRNAPPAKPTPIPAPRATMEINTEYNPPSSKPPRRSFWSRMFFCCSSRHESVPTNIPPASPAKNTPLPSAQRTNTTNSRTPLPTNMPEMPVTEKHEGKKLLALDLDETLVHSSFQPVDCASFVISVAIEGVVHNVYVIKRPGCDEFLTRMAEHYEVIIYTASLSKYADPLLDILDIDQVISKRLFRENCVFYDGHYVKDLSLLNREITQTIIVDNSPMSYIFHPENAIDCSSYFDNFKDTELWQIADFLISIKDVPDVRQVCRTWRSWCLEHPSKIPNQNGDQHQQQVSKNSPRGKRSPKNPNSHMNHKR